MWVVFIVFSHPCSEGFFPGSPVSIPPQKPIFQIPVRSGMCSWLVSIVGWLETWHTNKVTFFNLIYWEYLRRNILIFSPRPLHDQPGQNRCVSGQDHTFPSAIVVRVQRISHAQFSEDALPATGRRNTTFQQFLTLVNFSLTIESTLLTHVLKQNLKYLQYPNKMNCVLTKLAWRVVMCSSKVLILACKSLSKKSK